MFTQVIDRGLDLSDDFQHAVDLDLLGIDEIEAGLDRVRDAVAAVGQGKVAVVDSRRFQRRQP